VETKLSSFWEMLYMRNVSGREQLVNEGLRVVKTFKYIKKNNIEITSSKNDREKLFEIMKIISKEYSLGFFPGDRDFFHDLYTIGCDFDLFEFVMECYKNDRNGPVMAPGYLTSYINSLIEKEKPGKLLITEAEKYISGLKKLVEALPETEILLASENRQMFLVLSTYFEEAENVKVSTFSIYRELPFKSKFPCIVSVPSFAGRVGQDESSVKFQAREPEGIAVENLLEHLEPEGSLLMVTPARLTFAGGASANLRKWLTKNYGLRFICSLPEGTFRPFSGIKTYLMAATPKKTVSVLIGKLELARDRFELKESKMVPAEEFQRHDEWRVELWLAENLDEVQKFRFSNVPKVKLKEIAEVFRGKSVLKDDLKPGEFLVLNISNIEDGEVSFGGMDTIDEEERKLKRYQLEEGDLLLTCRGTVNKLAVFPKTERKVIASANIIVIRLKKDINSYFLKIFLESPLGEMLVKSFQRGTTVMNINPNDIAELEIPVLDMKKQQELIRRFNKGLASYQSEIKRLNDRWDTERTAIYHSIFKPEVQ